MNSDKELQRKALILFERLSELDAGSQARTRLLDEAAGDVRAMVGELEAADSRATDRFATILVAQGATTRKPPSRVGPYRLTELVGAGGMGEVWRAERADGLFEHAVAIKLLRRTFFSQASLDQFADERRILARLRHPHIAQMFDGGVTEDGAPYIIMELIAGEPITDYATRMRLNAAGRVSLFRQAAEAVAYAHSKLIVHADIKPSNVVVEEGFGVKLLDFGIARLLDGSGDQPRTAFTAAYASPARLAGEASTPADDIFATGKLLGELVGGAGDDSDADLVAIVGKAAADNPERRYSAVAEMLNDLQRWREHRPVVAGSASRSRAIRLFWRRNRLVLGLGVGGLVALIATLAVTTTSWLHAERARAIAERRFDETRAMANYMLSEVDPALSRLPGALPLRRELVARGRTYLQGLERDPRAGPDLQLEIAAGYLRLARIYGLDVSGGLGDTAAARASLQRAGELIRRAGGVRPPAPRLLLLRAQYDLVDASDVFSAPTGGRLEHARAELQAAQDLFLNYLRRVPGDVEARLGLWRAQVMMGRVFSYLGQSELSVRAIEPTLGEGAMQVATTAQQAERDFILSGADLILAEAYETISPTRSYAYYNMIVQKVSAIRTRGASDLQENYILATALAGKADHEVQGREYQGAVLDYSSSIREMDQLLEAGPNADLGTNRAYVEIRLANAYAHLHRFQGARDMSDRAIEWFRSTRSMDRKAADRLLAIALQARGVLERRAGDLSAACAINRQAGRLWTVLIASKTVMRIDVLSNGPIVKLRQALARCPQGAQAGLGLTPETLHSPATSR